MTTKTTTEYGRRANLLRRKLHDSRTPLGVFIKDDRWYTLRADGAERLANDGEVGTLPVTGKATTLTRVLLEDRRALLDAGELALAVLRGSPNVDKREAITALSIAVERAHGEAI